MVKEFRCIVFTSQEVIAAYMKRKQRMKEALPFGTILGMEFVNSETGAISTLRISEDSGNRINIEVGPAEMTAALIEYCLERRMPMPRQSRKTIEANSTQELTMMLYMNNCIPKKGARKPKSKYG